MELTKEDVARLMTNPSADTRAEIAGKLGLSLDGTELSQGELKLAQDIVRHMAADLTIQVRAALAQSVKTAKNLPHDVAVKMANDVEQVSLPVLECSVVFTDEDLVEIIKNQSPDKQEAIARREHVSEKLSAAIVEEAGEKAVAALIKNSGASISDAALDRVTEKFAANQSINDTLAKRDRLPLAVAERLVGRVSDALKEQLIKKNQFSEEVIARVVAQSREQSTAGLLGISKNEQDIEKLVQQLKKENRLTASLIIRALCVGDVRFFEASVAALGNVPLVNARVLIHDAGKLGLKSIYDKTGLPQGMFAIIRVALEVVQELQMDGTAHDQERYRAKIIERILTQYEDFNPDDLNFLLDRLSDLVDQAA